MKAGMFRLLAACLLAGLWGCELGGSPTGGGTGAEGLTGTIVDSRGAPVRGARVWLYPDTASILAKRAATAGFSGESLYTNKAGHFTFKGLPPGRYALSVLYTRHDSTFAIHQSGISVEGDVERKADTVQLAGNLYVYAGDALAKALPGARCEILGSPWYAVSNASGNCIFKNIGAGDLLVKVTAPGRTSSPATALVTSGDTTTACQVFLYQPDQEGWVLTTEGLFSFWIPPSLVMNQRGGSGASAYAYYSQPGLEMIYRNTSTIDLVDPAGFPEYHQDTVTIDTGKTLIVQSWRYPNPTESAVYGAQLDVSEWVFLLRAQTAEDLKTAVRILRTVRK